VLLPSFLPRPVRKIRERATIHLETQDSCTTRIAKQARVSPNALPQPHHCRLPSQHIQPACLPHLLSILPYPSLCHAPSFTILNSRRVFMKVEEGREEASRSHHSHCLPIHRTRWFEEELACRRGAEDKNPDRLPSVCRELRQMVEIHFCCLLRKYSRLWAMHPTRAHSAHSMQPKLAVTPTYASCLSFYSASLIDLDGTWLPTVCTMILFLFVRNSELAIADPFADGNTLDANPFADPSVRNALSSSNRAYDDYDTKSWNADEADSVATTPAALNRTDPAGSNARLEELQRRERELEQRERELQQRAEHIQKNGRNNWPFCEIYKLRRPFLEC
jgi:hypothetical protein